MKIPRCFGRYARFLYEEGVGPELCIECEVAEHCYRVTTADRLGSLASDLGLLIDNLLEQGKIHEYEEGPEDADDLDGVIPRQ